MRRTHSLSALFAALVAACGTGTGDTTNTSVDDTWDSSSCNDIPGSSEIEMPRSEVAAVVDADGTVPTNECYSLCTQFVGWGDITGCELLEVVEPAPPDAETDSDADSSGEGGDDTTGGNGTGTTGDADTGTTGDEDTEGATMGTTGLEDTVTVRCDYVEYCFAGRGHEALHPRPAPHGDDALARWLAATAYSEAASVVAFEALADELEAHGAPASLVERTRQAAHDEVIHARMMTQLAHQRGAQVSAPRFGAIRIRDLSSIAMDNAVEGCVRETWAALEAVHQARTATDPQLRRVMTRIAADETQHAELSRDLDAWLRTRLPAQTMARVDAARRAAAQELLAGMTGERDGDLCDQAGLPGAAAAQSMARGLRAQLWN